MILTLPDGSKRSYDAPITPEDLAGDIAKSLKKKTVAALVNGEVYDLNRPIEQNSVVSLITQDDAEGFEVLNHSTAHLMAQAVKSLYPDAQFGVGPAIEEGFYYDIATSHTIKEEDLALIEKTMRQLAKKGDEITRQEVSREAALDFFKADPYKTELISAIEDNQPITLYTQGEFVDLCRGGHVGNTRRIQHFKLLSLAGAYFRGDSNRPMLQRIYGTSWFTEDALKEHLAVLEDRKARDHRKLGKQLKIFHLSKEAGQGLASWLPNGYTVRKVLEDYVYEIERKAGYMHISTPVLGSKTLYEISGHWSHYRDNMFPIMEKDGEVFVLRPMSCPHHMLLFQSELRSYRDLPIRFAEIVTQHRYEASGALTGLERVRAMTLTDAHLFVREDQIKDEVLGCYNLITQAIDDLGLKVDYIELALRSEEKEKFHPNDTLWDMAEAMLETVLDDANIPYRKARGEAAFYGPKIDFQVRTALNHVITMSTIQLDFLLPERFDLTYIGSDGDKHRPVVIHRGLISTWERLMSILLEQYKGAFPVWLAPTQVTLIPVNNDAHEAYTHMVKERLIEEGFRVSVDWREEKLGYKMREAQTQKIPYTLVLGDQERDDTSVTYRVFGDRAQHTVTLDEYIAHLHEAIAKKSR